MTKKESKILEVKEAVLEYIGKDYRKADYVTVFGNKIGCDYTSEKDTSEKELRTLVAAYVNAKHKVTGVNLTVKVDTAYKVLWIYVETPESNNDVDFDASLILKRIKNAKRIKDAKLEQVTKAVERTLREYTDSIMKIAEDMTFEDFERFMTACGNEISPEEKELILGAYIKLYEDVMPCDTIYAIMQFM